MTSSGADRLKLIIESILFVADEPVEIAALARISGHNEGAVLDTVDAIAAEFQGRGLRIQRSAGAVQMVTAPEATPFVEQFLGVDEDHRISRYPVVFVDAQELLDKRRGLGRGDHLDGAGAALDAQTAALK